MLRRLALLLLVAFAAAAAVAACSGDTKNFTFDAGPGSTPVDAGPCDPVAQTNCPSGERCTIKSDGTPICSSIGLGAAYSACSKFPDGGGGGDDTLCSPGTACVQMNFTRNGIKYLSGLHCFPFCDPAVNPTDGGAGTCPGPGGWCALSFADAGFPHEGFCDAYVDAGR